MSNTTGPESAALHLGLDLLVLQGLVPLHIAKLRGRQPIWLQARAEEVADAIAASGDRAMHGSGRERGTALSAVAEGIAIRALLDPAGFDLLGVHWCADHHACGEGEATP